MQTIIKYFILLFFYMYLLIFSYTLTFCFCVMLLLHSSPPFAYAVSFCRRLTLSPPNFQLQVRPSQVDFFHNQREDWTMSGDLSNSCLFRYLFPLWPEFPLGSPTVTLSSVEQLQILISGFIHYSILPLNSILLLLISQISH